MGYQRIAEFIRTARNQSIEIFVDVPSMITNSSLANKYALNVNEARKLLRGKEVIGLGESYWAFVLHGDPRIITFIGEAKREVKRLTDVLLVPETLNSRLALPSVLARATNRPLPMKFWNDCNWVLMFW